MRRLLLMSSLTLVIACAANNLSQEGIDYQATTRGSECVSQFKIQGFNVLDARNLIVFEDSHQSYHVLIDRRAVGLRSSSELKFRSQTGEICSGTGELIIIREIGSGELFNIISVRRLTPNEEP